MQVFRDVFSPIKHARHYSEQKLQSVQHNKQASNNNGLESPKYDNHGALKTAAKLNLMSNDMLNFSNGLSPVNQKPFQISEKPKF